MDCFPLERMVLLFHFETSGTGGKKLTGSPISLSVKKCKIEKPFESTHNSRERERERETRTTKQRKNNTNIYIFGTIYAINSV